MEPEVRYVLMAEGGHRRFSWRRRVEGEDEGGYTGRLCMEELVWGRCSSGWLGWNGGSQPSDPLPLRRREP